ELSLLVDHGRPVDVALLEQVAQVRHRHVLRHGDRLPRHQVGGAQRLRLRFSDRLRFWDRLLLPGHRPLSSPASSSLSRARGSASISTTRLARAGRMPGRVPPWYPIVAWLNLHPFAVATMATRSSRAMVPAARALRNPAAAVALLGQMATP